MHKRKKIRRSQTRRCASHNFTKPAERVRGNWGAMEKSSATRKEKLAVHRVAKVVNKKWRQTLRKCEITERNGLWYVIPNNAPIDVGMYAYETISEAIDASRQI